MPCFRERVRGWKTLAFHGALGVAGAAMMILAGLEHIDLHPLLDPVLTPTGAGMVITAISVASIVLRVVTVGPVGWRKDPGADPQ